MYNLHSVFTLKALLVLLLLRTGLTISELCKVARVHVLRVTLGLTTLPDVTTLTSSAKK
jgi:hypothetical protein